MEHKFVTSTEAMFQIREKIKRQVSPTGLPSIVKTKFKLLIFYHFFFFLNHSMLIDPILMPCPLAGLFRSNNIRYWSGIG